MIKLLRIVLFFSVVLSNIKVEVSNIKKIPSKSDILTMSEEQKIQLYEENKINPYFNAMISALLPTYGHYKINKWSRGVKIFLLYPSSLMIMSMDFSPPWSRERFDSSPSDGVVPAEQVGKLINLLMIILLSDTFYQTTVYNKNLHKTIFHSE